MEPNFEHIDELVIKVLAGEANESERGELDMWMNMSEANRVYVNDAKRLFSAIEDNYAPKAVDVDAAWANLNSKINGKNGGKVISIFEKKNSMWRAAAAIVLLAVFTLTLRYFLNGGQVKPQMTVATNSVVKKQLPDGSQIIMNKNTEIEYVATKKGREVKLKGEAFFEVVHNEEQPFIINVEGVKIEDVGTAFNVKAIPGSDEIEVFVESGEVHFYSETSEGLNLVKGEKARYFKKQKRFEKATPNILDNTASYKSKIFHFNETSLKDVIRQLKEVYDLDVRLANEKMASYKLSVVFDNEDPEMILSIIAETLNLEIEKQGTTVVLKEAYQTE